MADFIRTKTPNKVTYPVMIPGQDSWGQSGKPQFRTTNQVGRTWIEEYAPMKASEADTRKFLAYINNLWRNRTIFTIQHKHLGVPINAPITGTLATNGASQTGSTLNVTANLTAALLYGDIITIAGINTVFDIVEDMTSGTDSTLIINPPITTGMTYSNPATITFNNVKFRCVLDEGLELPSCDIDGVYAGLTLKFREAP